MTGVGVGRRGRTESLTGTDPLDADSDDDGLEDGEEVFSQPGEERKLPRWQRPQWET